MGNGPKRPKRRARAKKKHFKKTVMNLRKRTADMDQVHEAVMKEKEEGKQLRPFDEDLPGGGQYECSYCARYFMNGKALENHKRSKDHKRTVKRIENEKPFTQREADAAAGMAPSDTSKESMQTVNNSAKASIQPHGGKYASTNSKDTKMAEGGSSVPKVDVSAADLPM
eukprot:gb/GECG01009058.1/.p1 GENE.gb/GECG01009058.1/~~gb/GECG01009058.1/.p1  ORF type:complete len:169 (+),score=34.58 gb/GECG01009058.1/:1-507(+)